MGELEIDDATAPVNAPGQTSRWRRNRRLLAGLLAVVVLAGAALAWLRSSASSRTLHAVSIVDSSDAGRAMAVSSRHAPIADHRGRPLGFLLTESADAHLSRRYFTYFYDYERNVTVRATVDLSTDSVIDLVSSPGSQLPPTAAELAEAARLLLADLTMGPALRAEFSASGIGELRGADQLNISGHLPTGSGDKGLGARSDDRLVVLSIEFPDGRWADLDGICVDLSTGAVRIDQRG